jgi:hypothetical protein
VINTNSATDSETNRGKSSEELAKQIIKEKAKDSITVSFQSVKNDVNEVDNVKRSEIKTNNTLEVSHTQEYTAPKIIAGTPHMQHEVRALCEKYREVFNMNLNDEPARITPMEIELISDWETRENSLNPRLQSLLKDKEITEQCSKMLQSKVIRASKASAHSQVMLTVKPNGTWRFCIDYRRLNNITKPQSWPLPRIKETLQRIGDKNPEFFAVFDLTKGYFQAPMAESSQKLTAFITRDGKYEWQRVPMGLTGAPSYFQRAMSNEVLHGLVHQICEVYLDDIIIHGTDEQDFLTNLKTVLLRLKEYNITVNPEKCRIGLTEIEYVGHTINKEGTHFSEAKLKKVIDVPIPEDAKALRSFVGLANYFRDHVHNHSARIEPLVRLLDDYAPRKKIDMANNPVALAAFQDIKTAINECPKLFFIDDHSPIHLYTDASIKGVGAYLCQRKADGKEYPIGFFSKSLNHTERRWGVPELEGYAIYAAFKHFDYLLRDAHTHVHTDHKNLVYIRDTGSDKVLRWKMMLQEYSFTTEFVAGVDNPIADYWSRNDKAEEDDYIVDRPAAGDNMLCSIEGGSEDYISLTTEGVANMFHDLSLHYTCELNNFGDIDAEVEEADEMFEISDTGISGFTNTASTKFEIPDIVYAKIREAHNPHVGHHGVEATLEKLVRKGCKWKYMREHVRKYVKECDTCQKASYLHYNINVPKYVTSGFYPMERLQIDTVGTFQEDEFGYKYVVVIVDCFSRFMTCYPVKTLEAVEAADALMTHIGHYGVPAQLTSDGGDQYVNAIIKELLEFTGTEHIIGMAYSHQENSIVERANREVSRWLREMIYDAEVRKSLWSRYLPFVQRIHNASTIKTIGYAPCQILFGDRVELDRDILLSREIRSGDTEPIGTWMKARNQFQDHVIAAAQKLQQKQHEKHLKLNLTKENTQEDSVNDMTDFPVDSYVLVAYPTTGYGPARPHKLYMMYRGPMKVINRHNNEFNLLNLVTEKVEKKKIFLLKPFYYNEKTTNPREVALRDYVSQNDVERILSHQGAWTRKRDTKFQVKWIGFEEITTEPWDNVKDCEAMETYLKSIDKLKMLPGYKKTNKKQKTNH